MNNEQKQEQSLDYLSEYERKSFFVKCYLKPLLCAMGINIIHADYTYNEKTQGEYVTITYKDGFFRRVCVTADSLRAIVSDVILRV